MVDIDVLFTIRFPATFITHFTTINANEKCKTAIEIEIEKHERENKNNTNF